MGRLGQSYLYNFIVLVWVSRAKYVDHFISARICQEEIECTKAKGQLISE
jgi:hypothetical protein